MTNDFTDLSKYRIYAFRILLRLLGAFKPANCNRLVVGKVRPSVFLRQWLPNQANLTEKIALLGKIP